jgi:glycosyltransferase involved in cell wall biosynthesis
MDLTALLGPRTGVGQMVRQLADRLPRQPGLDLTGLLVSWRGRGEATEVVPTGWDLQPLALPARLAHGAWRRFDRPRLRGFDLVHGPNYTVPPTAGGVRLVTVHDLTAWRYPELVDSHSRHYPRHLARVLADGGHVHAVSHHVARELEEDLAVDPERIHVVPNGLGPAPPGDGARGRARVGAPYVLAIGTIEPRKDYVSLVRAMAAIWPVLPDLRLVIAGPSGWGRPELDAVIDELGVADRVLCLGYVSDRAKADLLDGAEVMAYPSLYEGFGLPVLEAMQAGIPVVSTTAGAIPEVAGRAAVLVEPRDPSALAGALLTVLEDDGLRAQLGEAGRRRAAGFSWDDTADELARTYRLLTGEPVPSLPGVA